MVTLRAVYVVIDPKTIGPRIRHAPRL